MYIRCKSTSLNERVSIKFIFSHNQYCNFLSLFEASSCTDLFADATNTMRDKNISISINSFSLSSSINEAIYPNLYL